MEAHRSTVFTERGLSIRGARGGDGADTHLDLFAGAMHYWRVERSRWPACLDAMVGLGLGVVETCVPWRVHEAREGGAGSLDFTGDRDLGAFLDMVGDRGLRAVVRPGPRVNAELPLFGLPDRLLARDEILAVTGQGTRAFLPMPLRMFPVPSYASAAFHAEVAGWYRAVGEILAPRLAPDGPVVAIGIDDPASLFFRLGAYDLDYHPDALAWWREFVGPRPGQRPPVDPPRRWSSDDSERCLQWVAFKEVYAARSLALLGDSLAQAGLDRVASFPDRAGELDFHHRGGDPAILRERALGLVGAASPLPFAAEVGLGGPFWRPPGTPASGRQTLLTLLSCGVRGFNLYMTVGRDRWYGAPIDRDGRRDARLDPDSAWLPRLLAVLDEVQWTSLRRYAPVAVVSDRADARAAQASSLVDPVTPWLLDVLPMAAGSLDFASDESGSGHRRWLTRTCEALDLAQLPYDIVETISLEALARRRAVIIPTVDRVTRDSWKRLGQLAGPVIVLGPEKPLRDEFDRPLGQDGALPPGCGLIRPESADDIDGFADDLIALADERPDRPPDVWVSEQSDVACSLFVDAQGAPRVLFVANQSGENVSAELVVPDHTRLTDALASETFSDREGSTTIALEPHDIRLLIIDGDGDSDGGSSAGPA